MTGPVIVINPNSTEQVTRAMDQALEPLRLAAGPEIESLTNPGGPPGVETQEHVDRVASDVVRMVREHEQRASAFVVACFSDPGLHAAREATTRPVFGIAESGMLAALSLGNRFGVLAILSGSVPRHLRYIRSLGIESRLAADLPIGLSVVELADASRTLARLGEVGETLRDHHGADVLVLGCAGMAACRSPLEERLGITVIDPTQVAVCAALAAVRLGQTTGPRRRTA